MASSNNVLITSDGTELPVTNASTTVATNRAMLAAGTDGTTNRLITLDSSGRQLVVGAGVAGTPAGGVITIQGVSGGVVVPVSGTVTVTQATAANLRAQTSSESNTGATPPTQATYTGGSVTTAAPTYITGQMNALSLNTSGALRSDLSSWIGSTAPTIGQKTMNNSIPVTIADNQSSLLVGGSSDGYNNIPLKTDASGSLQVVVNTVASGANAQISYGDITLNSITTSFIARTPYTEPSANFQGSIVSSSANDTAAGTGARTVRIYWMDVTGVTIGTEDVTLNGTTNVNLVTTTKCYIENIEVLTVGSTGSNVGIITLRTGLAGGGTVVGTIAATNNRTFWAHHYVQSGKVCNINGIIGGSTASTVGAGSSFFIRAIPVGVTNQVEKQVSDTVTLYGQANQVVRNYITAIPVATGPARMRMYVTTLSSTSIVYRGSFDFIDDVP